MAKFDGVLVILLGGPPDDQIPESPDPTEGYKYRTSRHLKIKEEVLISALPGKKFKMTSGGTGSKAIYQENDLAWLPSASSQRILVVTDTSQATSMLQQISKRLLVHTLVVLEDRKLFESCNLESYAASKLIAAFERAETLAAGFYPPSTAHN